MVSDSNIILSSLSLMMVVVLRIVPISAFNNQATVSTMSQYEPELAQDAIPIISSRSLIKPNTYDVDQDDEGGSSMIHQKAPLTPNLQRRGDFDDNTEDDDEDERDEYKSGSNNHDSYDNPAFGESRSAAKDGEDIESFFDKHIGPGELSPAASNNGDRLQEVPLNQPIVMASEQSDPDDYDTAASSPLSNIFHSLLNHAHKNKLIITTTDDSPADQQSGGEQHALGTSQAANPMGSSSRDTAYVEATPIAYFTPIPAPSNQAGTGEEDDSPVREIYITRRPLMSHAYHQQPVSMSGQSSNANWRGSYPTTNRYYQQQQQQGHYDYGSGMAMPVAASYAYNNREQPMATDQPEDEQTVSYGLSFGAANDENETGNGVGNSNESQSADEEQQNDAGYNPYPARNNMMRHSSSMRYYQNYNYAPNIPGQGYTRAQSYQQMPEHQGYQRQQYQGSMYHRDPSESQVGGGGGYNQYRKGSSSTKVNRQQQNGSNDWARRQKLLADVDRQIKQSSHYRQAATNSVPTAYSTQGQQQLAPMRAAQLPVSNQAITTKLESTESSSPVGNDYDTYNSYHQEVDPYRSLTTVSRSVSGPLETGTRSNITATAAIVNGNSNKEAPEVEGASAQTNKNILSGPVVHFANDDLLRNGRDTSRVNLRVRRDDSDDRESDVDEDDGVWVDDDEDDADNRQQSSDVNETAQEPGEIDEGVTDAADDPINGGVSRASNYVPVNGHHPMNPPGVIGGPHGYELSPHDLMIYNGR